LRFQPSGPLDPNKTYDIALGPGLLGADGTGMPAGVSWTFTTGAPTATLSNQVVFVSDRAGIANLWAMNPDGSNQRQLSAELSQITSYAIAPDGRAFVTGDGAVVVWQRTDGTARRLLTDPDVVEFDAAYSPDGTVITFGRADPTLGSSLGLWMRDADGSDPRPIELPSAQPPSPSASQATPMPLLRAPRISPDGTALAFVDEAGRVGILDLELEATQVARLQVVRMGLFATSVSATAFGSGASRPAVDAAGYYAFIRLAGAEVGGGDLWVASALADAGQAIPGSRTRSASFAPEPGSIVIGVEPGGVLLIGPASAERLTADGWLPHWLP
ncbi:MAG: hypothetical protein M3537_06350, partial [Chloroflexota bacterium]|nr:hypothetical protein [Chloroflexota bacterium]